MMFGCKDNAFGASQPGNTCPLPAIQCSRIKYIWSLITFPPFFIRKRIGSEMDEEIKFFFMPCQLFFRRNGVDGLYVLRLGLEG